MRLGNTSGATHWNTAAVTLLSNLVTEAITPWDGVSILGNGTVNNRATPCAFSPPLPFPPRFPRTDPICSFLPPPKKLLGYLLGNPDPTTTLASSTATTFGSQRGTNFSRSASPTAPTAPPPLVHSSPPPCPPPRAERRRDLLHRRPQPRPPSRLGRRVCEYRTGGTEGARWSCRWSDGWSLGEGGDEEARNRHFFFFFSFLLGAHRHPSEAIPWRSSRGDLSSLRPVVRFPTVALKMRN